MAKSEGWPETRERWHQFNDITAGELLEWCWANNLRYEDVRITHVAMKWFAPETDEERARREAAEQDQRARQERWERQTYAQLKEKYDA